jgi:hypothetical protein
MHADAHERTTGSNFGILPNQGDIGSDSHINLLLTALCTDSGLYQQSFDVVCDDWSTRVDITCEAGLPSLEIDCDTLAFGICQTEQRVSKILSLYNCGTFPLRLLLTMVPPHPAFLVHPPKLMLGLNQRTDVEVQFFPSHEEPAAIDLEVAWPGPTRVIRVTGQGGSPRVVVEYVAAEDVLAQELAYGHCITSVLQWRTVKLVNCGTLPTEFVLSRPETAPWLALREPWTWNDRHVLPALSEVELQVSALPAFGPASTVIAVQSFGGDQRIPVTIKGGVLRMEAATPVLDFQDVNVNKLHRRWLDLSNTGDITCLVRVLNEPMSGTGVFSVDPAALDDQQCCRLPATGVLRVPILFTSAEEGECVGRIVITPLITGGTVVTVEVHAIAAFLDLAVVESLVVDTGKTIEGFTRTVTRTVRNPTRYSLECELRLVAPVPHVRGRPLWSVTPNQVTVLPPGTDVTASIMYDSCDAQDDDWHECTLQVWNVTTQDEDVSVQLRGTVAKPKMTLYYQPDLDPHTAPYDYQPSTPNSWHLGKVLPHTLVEFDFTVLNIGTGLLEFRADVATPEAAEAAAASASAPAVFSIVQRVKGERVPYSHGGVEEKEDVDLIVLFAPTTSGQFTAVLTLASVAGGTEVIQLTGSASTFAYALETTSPIDMGNLRLGSSVSMTMPFRNQVSDPNPICVSLAEDQLTSLWTALLHRGPIQRMETQVDPERVIPPGVFFSQTACYLPPVSEEQKEATALTLTLSLPFTLLADGKQPDMETIRGHLALLVDPDKDITAVQEKVFFLHTLAAGVQPFRFTYTVYNPQITVNAPITGLEFGFNLCGFTKRVTIMVSNSCDYPLPLHVTSSHPEFTIVPDKGLLPARGRMSFPIRFCSQMAFDSAALSPMPLLTIQVLEGLLPPLTIPLKASSAKFVFDTDKLQPVDFGSHLLNLTNTVTSALQLLSTAGHKILYTAKIIRRQSGVSGVMATATEHKSDAAAAGVSDEMTDLPFRIIEGAEGTVMPKDTNKFITVVFSPHIEGEFVADLELKTETGAFLVPLTGLGVTPTVSVAPDAIDFGMVAYDLPQTRRLTVTNTCSEPIKLRANKLPPNWSVSIEMSTALLEPKATAVVRMTFFPKTVRGSTKTVKEQCQLEVLHADWKPVLATVPCVGMAGPLSMKIAPRVIDLGMVPCGDRVRRPVVFFNDGSAAIRLLLAPTEIDTPIGDVDVAADAAHAHAHTWWDMPQGRFRVQPRTTLQVLFSLAFRIPLSRDATIRSIPMTNVPWVLQTVLVMNMFASLVPPTHSVDNVCTPRTSTKNHRFCQASKSRPTWNFTSLGSGRLKPNYSCTCSSSFVTFHTRVSVCLSLVRWCDAIVDPPFLASPGCVLLFTLARSNAQR